MAEIIKTYRQNVPAMRFIGKIYTNADRADGDFGAKWSEWSDNCWFELIDKQICGSLKDVYEDGDCCIGLMFAEGEGDYDAIFRYCIGKFTPAETPVPQGFEHIDFPAGELGVCWLKGSEDEIFCKEGMCCDKLAATYEIDDNLCFERYNDDRIHKPDEEGNVIIDICFYLK